jgi:hypothetical protein
LGAFSDTRKKKQGAWPVLVAAHPALGAVWENTLTIEQSSAVLYSGNAGISVTLPENSPPCPLTSDYLSARSASGGRGILIVDLLILLGALRSRLGFVGCLFAGVFGIAPSVLNLAFRLLHGSVHFLFLVARPFPGLTFNPSRYVLNLAFNLIFIHHTLLLLSLCCFAGQ